MGHEFSGEVVDIGKDVKNVKIGDRVVVEPMDVCGKCPACLSGKCNLCYSLGFHGLAGGGEFSEYTTFLSKFVHKIPDTLSYEKAALIEPMSVALHSLRVGSFEIGQSAIVTGAGPIVLSEKKIIGSICYCNDFPSTIAMMADNRIKADGYITKKIYIDDIIKEGFETLTGKT